MNTAETTISAASRELAMCEMYRAGRTLQQIGDVFGVTRERVRQLIRPMGVARKDGGRAQAVAAAKRARQDRLAAAREAKAMRTYGCGYAEAKRLNFGMQFADIGSPAYAYMRDRCNHTRHGGIFALTFPQWISLFESAGGIWNRGRFAGGLVLGRIDKSGDFVMGNVHVITLDENCRDTRLRYLSSKEASA
jgi:DNA-binding CsgD family transcriptional regulator